MRVQCISSANYSTEIVHTAMNPLQPIQHSITNSQMSGGQQLEAEGSQAHYSYSHPDSISLSQLSQSAHLALEHLSTQPNTDHQRVASLVRNAVQDGKFRLQSSNDMQVTYKTSVCPPANADTMGAAHLINNELTVQARLNDQLEYDIVSAHLYGPSEAISIDASSPPSANDLASSGLSERTHLGMNRVLLRYAVPPRETEDQCVMVIDKMPPPKHGKMSFFRTTNDLSKLPLGMETGGLSDLKLAGCERISSVEQVKSIRAALGGGPLTVLDLREESHAIVNGLPITLRGPMDWANAGLSQVDGAARESAMITELKRTKSLTLVDANYVKGKKSNPQTTELKNLNVRSEREVVTEAGATYRRVAITDHNRPSPEATDELVDIMRHCLQANESLVVHCNGGRGRTTTAMIMVDMLKNARNHSAETLITRMAKLSYDYNMTDLGSISALKRPFLEDRLKFLQAFHDYARNNPSGLSLNWTQWRAKIALE
ncbi:Effector protein hopD2 [Pseudomonas cannabina pv. alisalensis]|uniref:Effector protein hopD2 n=3 Tax=Pseudomonas syringae group TaxID=136849 RepID=A0A3M3S1V7_PSECA|nr:Effector protein hopD2 [Pseudomonas cannabina pv. alisalensis]RMN81037.1 Effector protein hopD2 [Pseudomonas cannabina pv. alisalensis]RMN85315.1 Effector protein hopD2 [Pseudomonas cannabina]RMO02649.1 Effector protein hopD2 [Pseudomonas cannabina]